MTDRALTKVETEWAAGSLIYLATPFTRSPQGFECAAWTAANIAARLSMATHGAVFSPIVHGYHLSVASNADPVADAVLWEHLNERMLQECDVLVIAHMDGWEESDGIAQEIAFFQAAGKPIWDLYDVQHLSMSHRRPQKPPRERYDGTPHEALESDKREYLGHSNGGRIEP